ncbi:MAG: hypothetical protein GXP53_03410 [Deltaproteobacteria bacterium]|nr:hypothetical protein [Deltaproteobacteria bacterium]
MALFKLNIVFVLFFSLLFCNQAAAALEKSSKKECAMCHIMWLDEFRSTSETLVEWQPGNVLMKDTQGVVSSEDICYSCHDGYVVDSRFSVWKNKNHSTFVKPSKNIRVPDSLPLSNKGEIYCGTCHSPHGIGSAPKKNSVGPTSFFRLTNTDSSLCEMCHINEADYKRTKGHPLHTTEMKLPDKLFELGSIKGKNKDSITCQTCHKVHGAKGKNITIVDNSQSRLCMLCHKERTIAGTPHDLRLTLANEKNIKQQPLSESGPCGACHIPHNAAGSMLWARNSKPGDTPSEMCLSCHDKNPDDKIKDTGRYSHPINVEQKLNLNRQGSEMAAAGRLPLFSKTVEKQPVKTVQCATCHNPHQWDPNAAENRGGKDVDGNASNSFLRISNSGSSELCLECHTDKKQLLSYDHNLEITAPNAKNSRGLTAKQSGPCGACHMPHNATGPKLWARELSGDKDRLSQYCIKCHDKNGAANKKPTGEYDHPVNIVYKGLNLTPRDQVVEKLPLFNDDGSRKKGEIIKCLTCHEPHTWDPLHPYPPNHQLFKNIEGNSNNSFLRKANSPASDLCEICHTDKAIVEGTDHDLSVTAKEAKNLEGKTVDESGTCSACHIPHNSPNALKLWARKYGPVPPKNPAMNGLCTSCHSKGRLAEKKVPGIATHPEGRLINNIVDISRDALKYTPIFDDSGKRASVGNISCPSCHNAHQWSSLVKQRGIYRNLDGNAKTSFLRNVSYKNICVDCHAEDAIIRYRLFHNPKIRGSFKNSKDSKPVP